MHQAQQRHFDVEARLVGELDVLLDLGQQIEAAQQILERVGLADRLLPIDFAFSGDIGTWPACRATSAVGGQAAASSVLDWSCIFGSSGLRAGCVGALAGISKRRSTAS